MQQSNPYPPSAPNIPTQTIPKTNWALYIITIIISFVILLLLAGGLPLYVSFLRLTSLTILFISISIVSLVIGLIVGFILNKIAKSNKSFLLGASITSFLCATIVSISLSVQKTLTERLAALETEGFGGGLSGLIGLPGETPNPLLTGFLIILFFNITPLILFFRKEEKYIQELLIYFYSLVIYLLLYFTIPLILFSM